MKKIIACYMRVSKSQGKYMESQSITNQRLYIKDYIEKYIVNVKGIVSESIKEYMEDTDNRGINEYMDDGYIWGIKEYIDDGYSGRHLDRPGINELFKDILSDKICIIIVKDFSRFSRNYIIMGEYLEWITTQCRIRFIAINDNYDSKIYRVRFYDKNKNYGMIDDMHDDIHRYNTNLDSGFKHIVYDYYSAINSEKIKKGLDIARSKGKYICVRPIYGYIRDGDNLIIDEKKAFYIREIYKRYIGGDKVKDISDDFNKKYSSFDDIWSRNKIYRILREEQYTGVLIYGKRKNIDIASKKRVYCDRNLWKRIENHHEAIIDKEVFDMARKRSIATK